MAALRTMLLGILRSSALVLVVLPVAGAAGTPPIRLDPSLVLPLSMVPAEITNRVITPVPVVAHFSRGPYHVYFVAAAHETGPGPTFSLITRAFDRFQPSAVIREGLDFASGPIPRSRATEIEREGGPRSEADHAVALALARSLPVYGGEPTEEEKFQLAAADGYSRAEFISLEFLSMVGYYARVGQWRPERASEVFSEVSAWLKPRADAKPFDYGQFLALFKEKTGKDFDPAHPEELLAGPDPNGDFWQKIGHSVDMGRNRFLATVLSEALYRHKRVLVVYGNGHLATHWRALIDAFGEPIYLGTLRMKRRSSARGQVPSGTTDEASPNEALLPPPAKQRNTQ